MKGCFQVLFRISVSLVRSCSLHRPRLTKQNAINSFCSFLANAVSQRRTSWIAEIPPQSLWKHPFYFSTILEFLSSFPVSFLLKTIIVQHLFLPNLISCIDIRNKDFPSQQNSVSSGMLPTIPESSSDQY